MYLFLQQWGGCAHSKKDEARVLLSIVTMVLVYLLGSSLEILKDPCHMEKIDK